MSQNPFQDKTDEKLAELTLENEDNFLHLMNRYEGKLISYIRKISNLDYEEAEDVLQDVFIKVYQNLNNFDTSLKFSSWIYRITHNQVISNFRKQKARPEGISYDFDSNLFKKLVSELDTSRDIEIEMLRQSINKVLANLDLKYKEVLILYYLEEKDYKEISDILKKPIGTVGTLLNRAKKEFREEMKKQALIF